MKKLIILLSFMFVSLVMVAQTTVRNDVVLTKYGGVGDTLNLDASINDTYYVDDFSTDAELFWDVDSVSGTPKVLLEFNGSYDNSEWIVIDTVTATIAVGDTTKVQSSGTYLYPYLQAKATALDNTQTIRYKYVLVIKKN